jgi:hypothetical protein
MNVVKALIFPINWSTEFSEPWRSLGLRWRHRLAEGLTDSPPGDALLVVHMKLLHRQGKLKKAPK